ncbi:MAG: agmatinase [Pacificimonas sp.]|nr:agmatinase [Pacificimonas sp.]
MTQIRVLGLPTDANSSFLKGPAKAPPLVRDMMMSDKGNLSTELGGTFGEEIDVVDDGDLTLDGTPEDDQRIRDAVAAILADDDIPILIGGDHAVTYPIMQAIAEKHGPVSILHFDAHPDLYDELLGNRRSHASPFARIMEDKLASRLVQVGIRTLTPHQREQAARFGVEIIPMRGFAVEDVPLPDGPVYVSFDLDGLDPAYAPGVSHHEPGGLSVREALDLLDRIKGPVVGADVVEYNPDRDTHEMTCSVAAKLASELIAIAAR